MCLLFDELTYFFGIDRVYTKILRYEEKIRAYWFVITTCC